MSRRNSIVNIDEWLDHCSNEEPDSIIYDADYVNDVAIMRTRQKSTEIEGLFKNAADTYTKMGLPPDALDERLTDIEECLTVYINTIIKDIQDEYAKLVQYKQALFEKIQKMRSDLHLPSHIPEDNITLLQSCKKLKTEFGKLNIVREKRMDELRELREKQAKLCQVLGVQPEQIQMQTDIPTEEELLQFAKKIIDLEKEEKDRKEQYRLLENAIRRCMDLLEVRDKQSVEVFERPDFSKDNLQRLKELHAKYEAQCAENQKRFEELRDRLVSLYDRLDIPKPEREDFLESHSLCKPSLMSEIEVKINEYEELKKQNIGKFIEKLRRELSVEYDRCFVSQDTQDVFFSLGAEPSERLLELYEKELARLKEYYKNNEQILENFNQWCNMWNDLMDLEREASNPNRFNNRGGRLLNEERKRKTLQKNLPIIEKKLTVLNDKYLAINGEKFKVYGMPLDKYISGRWDELQIHKEQEKLERQKFKMTPSKGLGPVAVRKTPLERQAKGTPLKRAVNGSRLLGPLSINEQEFEAMVVARPTSAKRRPIGPGKY